MRRFIAIAGVAACALAGTSTLYASIDPINLLATDGLWSIDGQQFISGSAGGPFGLDTLKWQETAQGDLGPFDVEFSVEQLTSVDPVVISLDKEVTNNTGVDWGGFHLTLGTGLGSGFVESNDSDSLFFSLTPNAPVDLTGTFPVVEGEASSLLMPDHLSFTGGTAKDGIGHNPWIALSVADGIDGTIDGVATFTLRQHALVAVPEPSTLVLFMMTGVLLTRRRRRSLRRLARSG